MKTLLIITLLNAGFALACDKNFQANTPLHILSISDSVFSQQVFAARNILSKKCPISAHEITFPMLKSDDYRLSTELKKITKNKYDLAFVSTGLQEIDESVTGVFFLGNPDKLLTSTASDKSILYTIIYNKLLSKIVSYKIFFLKGVFWLSKFLNKNNQELKFKDLKNILNFYDNIKFVWKMKASMDLLNSYIALIYLEQLGPNEALQMLPEETNLGSYTRTIKRLLYHKIGVPSDHLKLKYNNANSSSTFLTDLNTLLDLPYTKKSKFCFNMAERRFSDRFIHIQILFYCTKNNKTKLLYAKKLSQNHKDSLYFLLKYVNILDANSHTEKQLISDSYEKFKIEKNSTNKKWLANLLFSYISIHTLQKKYESIYLEIQPWVLNRMQALNTDYWHHIPPFLRDLIYTDINKKITILESKYLPNSLFKKLISDISQKVNKVVIVSYPHVILESHIYAFQKYDNAALFVPQNFSNFNKTYIRSDGIHYSGKGQEWLANNIANLIWKCSKLNDEKWKNCASNWQQHQ